MQCALSATIWACGRPRDPYFVILGGHHWCLRVGFDTSSTLGAVPERWARPDVVHLYPPCHTTGLPKHGDPVFPHSWAFFWNHRFCGANPTENAVCCVTEGVRLGVGDGEAGLVLLGVPEGVWLGVAVGVALAVTAAEVWVGVYVGVPVGVWVGVSVGVV